MYSCAIPRVRCVSHRVHHALHHVHHALHTLSSTTTSHTVGELAQELGIKQGATEGDINTRLKALIASHPVMLFMKVCFVGEGGGCTCIHMLTCVAMYYVSIPTSSQLVNS